MVCLINLVVNKSTIYWWFAFLLDLVHNQAGIQYDKNKDSMNYGNIVLYSAEHQTYEQNMNYQRMKDRLKEKQVWHTIDVPVFWFVSFLIV